MHSKRSSKNARRPGCISSTQTLIVHRKHLEEDASDCKTRSLSESLWSFLVALNLYKMCPVGKVGGKLLMHCVTNSNVS